MSYTNLIFCGYDSDLAKKLIEIILKYLKKTEQIEFVQKTEQGAVVYESDKLPLQCIKLIDITNNQLKSKGSIFDEYTNSTDNNILIYTISYSYPLKEQDRKYIRDIIIKYEQNSLNLFCFIDISKLPNSVNPDDYKRHCKNYLNLNNDVEKKLFLVNFDNLDKIYQKDSLQEELEKSDVLGLINELKESLKCNSQFKNTSEYSVNISQYFGRGWEIFSQYSSGFLGFSLPVTAIIIVTSLIPALWILDIVIDYVLYPILSAGFYIVALQIAKNRPKHFSDFFIKFNQFMKLLPVHITATILILCGSILFLIPGIYLFIAYTFSFLFVIEKESNFWSALEESRKLISQKWFSFLYLYILLFLLNLGGSITLLGLVVTIPWSYCILVAAFEDIVGITPR